MSTEDRFQSTGGMNIFLRSWRPKEPARAVVAIVHGFNAHSGHYEWVGEQLTAAGLAAYALDLRGRGRSDGERFYVQKFGDYVGDVAGMVSIIRNREPGVPIFMLGHSAGGVVACMFALEHPGELSGFICESFAHEVPAPSFVLAVMKGLSHVAPHAHVLKLKNEDFSRDPARVAELDNDPLIAHEVQATQTVAEMVRADDRLKKEFGRITLPLLILHGTADKAAKPSGSKHFYELAGSSDKLLKLYEGYYHDPLADRGKEAVMADIIAWLNTRIPAARMPRLVR
jgi:alpha-beta hydrolase superfamily lysophospholipase